jgi:hypothetical protein
MALGSTEPLTETSTRNLPGGKGQLAGKADNLTAICKPIVYKMWEPQHLTTLWASTACYRDNFTFYFFFYCHLYPDDVKVSYFLCLTKISLSVSLTINMSYDLQ